MSDFKERVYELVAQIPHGRVMTYSQIAALAGQPRAARIVGGIAHYGPEDLPWQRVVMMDGGMARGFPGGMGEHARLLRAEGIPIGDDLQLDIQQFIWWPPQEQ